MNWESRSWPTSVLEWHRVLISQSFCGRPSIERVALHLRCYHVTYSNSMTGSFTPKKLEHNQIIRGLGSEKKNIRSIFHFRWQSNFLATQRPDFWLALTGLGIWMDLSVAERPSDGPYGLSTWSTFTLVNSLEFSKKSPMFNGQSPFLN